MLTTLLFASLTQAAPDFAAPERLARIEIPAGEMLPIDVPRLDLDVIYNDRRTGAVTVLAAASDLARLDEEGIGFNVVHPDEQAFYASRLGGDNQLLGAPQYGAFLSPPFGSGSMGGYYNWSQVVSVLDQLRSNFPNLVSAKQSIGQSIQGRDIWAVRISDNPDVDENEAEVRFDSLHHSREPQGMQTSLWFVLWALESYGSDPLATYLLNERELWIIPVVNPDGYVYNQQIAPGGGGLWRKNRRNNGGGDFGVDLNRNYPFQWGYDNVGSSPSPDSETYRGTAPASEPETQAMVSFIQSHDFGTALSIHTFSNLWLFPYGYDFVDVPNKSEYDELSDLATEVNGYEAGAPPFVLYTANGGTNDFDQQQDTLSWTPEIGSQSDGFWPQTSRIVPLAEENLLAFQRTALAGGAWARVESQSFAEQGDGDGFLQPGESALLTVNVRNSGHDATSTPVSVELVSSSPFANITTSSVSLGTLGSFQSTNNAGSPLVLAIAANAPDGEAIAYELHVTYEGFTQVASGVLAIGTPRALISDNLNQDFGWTAGVAGDTASTGIWERANPIGTTNGGEQVAPGNDATPGAGGQAFVTGNGGGSAGTDDVDDGITTLISPPFDLSSTPAADLSYARWFAEQSAVDDVFEISVSNDDGASWLPLETISGNQNEWITSSFALSEVLPLTDAMRLRFIASDDPNNSLTEAAVDELKVTGYGTAPRLVTYGTTEVGTPIAIDISADAGSGHTVYWSPFTGALTIPGISGEILIDPFTAAFLLSGSIPSGGLDIQSVTIPNSAGLVGETIYLQALVTGSTLSLTNRAAVTFE